MLRVVIFSAGSPSPDAMGEEKLLQHLRKSTITGRDIRDFLDRFAAVPFYGVRHSRLQRVQFVSRAPADVVMLLGCASNIRGVLRSGPVNHSDVFVCVGDAV